MTNITNRELSVLTVLAGAGVDYYLPFSAIADRCEVERGNVRRVTRSLARKGLAEFKRGLFTEDGEVAGAGYGATDLGRALSTLGS